MGELVGENIKSENGGYGKGMLEGEELEVLPDQTKEQLTKAEKFVFVSITA